MKLEDLRVLCDQLNEAQATPAKLWLRPERRIGEVLVFLLRTSAGCGVEARLGYDKTSQEWMVLYIL